MKFTALGAATATATALTVGIPPDPQPEREAGPKLVDANVDLAAAFRPFPPPPAIPDLTGGLGSAVYNFGQTAADTLLRAIVENFNLAALAQAAGADPDTVVDALLGGVLGQIPAGLLDDVIGAIPIDVSAVVDALLAPLGLDAGGVIGDLLAGALPNTLDGLLGLLGLDLSDALNLSDLAGPANIITTGPVFTLLKLLGADLGWVPGLPNSVADEINNSEYLDVEVSLSDLFDSLGVLGDIIEALPGDIPDLDIIEVRAPVVVGFGLGAFAAGMAYEQVVNDLENQPGGTASDEHPLLGSITILPMILLRNPGRANGGLFARFYPLFRLLGIDTVTPETEASHDGGIPILDTGLSLGGANLIPVKIDGTIMYDFMSDFASWPNPFSLANNVMAGLLPTYILRGVTLDTVPEQLLDQLGELLDGVLEGDPLALNLYLTIPTATLPLLEPLYLAADLMNLVTLGAASQFNPFSLIANALAPAFTSLVNLGYTDVVFNPETGAYERTLLDPDDPTAFFSFPDVNWGQVPGVVLNQLLQGIQKEFLSGNPTPGTPNVLSNLLDFLGGDLLGGLPLGNLTDLVESILGALNPLGLAQQAAVQDETMLASATSLPEANARSFTLSTEAAEDESLLEATDSEDMVDEDVVDEDVVDEDVVDEDVVDEDVVDEDVVDEDVVDEDVVDEDAADEDVVDEDAADEDADDQDADDQDQNTDDAPGTVSDITKGGNFNAPDSKPSGPRHAKADNDSPNPDADSTDGTDSTSSSDDGSSSNAA